LKDLLENEALRETNGRNTVLVPSGCFRSVALGHGTRNSPAGAAAAEKKSPPDGIVVGGLPRERLEIVCSKRMG
jgi:hypothetical protein